MPAVTTKTRAVALSAEIPLTTAYSDGAATFGLGSREAGQLLAVHFFGSGIAGPQTLTVQLFRDSRLNMLAVPETAIPTVPGVADPTSWSALLLCDIGHPGEANALHVRAKLGAGTGQVETASRLVWRE